MSAPLHQPLFYFQCFVATGEMEVRAALGVSDVERWALANPEERRVFRLFLRCSGVFSTPHFGRALLRRKILISVFLGLGIVRSHRCLQIFFMHVQCAGNPSHLGCHSEQHFRGVGPVPSLAERNHRPRELGKQVSASQSAC